MADITEIPTDQLLQMYEGGGSDVPDISSVSTEDLLQMYQPQAQAAERSIMDRLLTRETGERISAEQATLGPLMTGLNALTFGYGDEIVSGGNAAVGSLFGEDFSDTYDQTKDKLNFYRGDFKKTEPALGFGLEMAGVSKVPIGSAIGKRSTVLGKTGQAALEGAGYGAAYASGEGDGILDRLERAAEGGKTGAVIGGGLGMAGGLVSKTMRGAQKAAPKAADQLELGAFGVDKTLQKQANERFFDQLVDNKAMAAKNPLQIAVHDFRKMAGNTIDDHDPVALVDQLMKQERALATELTEKLGEAATKQKGSLTPDFRRSIAYVESLPGVDKEQGRAILQKAIRDTLGDVDRSNILSLHDQKLALGRQISQHAWGQDRTAIETNVLKRIYSDLRRTIEDGYERVTGNSGKEVHDLNERIGRRLGLHKAFANLLANSQTGDVVKQIQAALRTSGGFGVPAIVGGMAAGVPGAILGPAAAYQLNKPGTRLAISDALRSDAVRGGLGAISSIGDSLASEGPRLLAGPVASVEQSPQELQRPDTITGSPSRQTEQQGEIPLRGESMPSTARQRSMQNREGYSSPDYNPTSARSLPTDAEILDAALNGMNSQGESVELSPRGLDLIRQFEGYRSEPYDDGGGVMTIGYGHTGEGVAEGSVDEARALELLAMDTAIAQAAVNEAVQVPLTQNQFDALTSFVFNVGPEAFRRSTLLRLLNAGQTEAAAREFSRWVHDNGRRVEGLARRRGREAELFLA